MLPGVLLILACLAPLAPPQEVVIEPWEGVRVMRELAVEPRPLVIHLVEIDPQSVRFVATPSNEAAPGETTLQTTRHFVDSYELHLAVNAHFFRLPYQVGDLTLPFADLLGLAVADGEEVSPPEAGRPALGLDRETRRLIWAGEAQLPEGVAKADLEFAVAGSQVVVRDGRNTAPQRTALHPRTAIASRADGTLLLMVVDGRQPGVSEGVTQAELADLLLDAGAMLAINLDGGGSTTLALRDEKGRARLVNVPVGRGPPGSERPVGSNLGVKVSR